jgi:AbrB family looped-hinge helix DNA binding protein
VEQNSGQGHKVYQSRVDKSGRIVLPAEVRSAFGLKVGSPVLVVQDETGVRLETPEHALRALQEYFMKLAPPGVSMVDELIQEHREEAERE